MTVETETLILKAIEKLEQKLDKFIDNTNQEFKNINQTLTSIQVNQGIQGEQIKELQKGQDKQTTWLLSLVTGLVLGLLGLVTAVGKVVFFPNP